MEQALIAAGPLEAIVRGYGMQTNELNCLAEKWEHLAKCKFQSAEHEKLPMGKRLIEHGAICYLNCARELREALAGLLPQEPANLSGDQT